jgi:hypothetical protein
MFRRTAPWGCKKGSTVHIYIYQLQVRLTLLQSYLQAQNVQSSRVSLDRVSSHRRPAQIFYQHSENVAARRIQEHLELFVGRICKSITSWSLLK